MDLTNRKKIALLVVYYGAWPAWINYFLSSCMHNKACDFLIISDTDPKQIKISNVFFFPLSLSELSRLIRHKSGIPTEIKDPYKLCDFRPLYGIIFEDYLKDYLFWGYCDIDLILGDLTRFLSEDSITGYDIFFGYEQFASGPFSLYRNVPEINCLYYKIDGLMEALSNPEYQGLDENRKMPLLKISILLKVLILLRFLCKLINLDNIGSIRSIHELKFQYYWFFKKNAVRIPQDITEVVLKEAKKERIRINSGHFILSDVYFNRIKLHNWEIRYTDGKLTETSIHNKIAIFHFREIKNTPEFIIESALQNINRFCISSLGIRKCHE